MSALLSLRSIHWEYTNTRTQVIKCLEKELFLINILVLVTNTSTSTTHIVVVLSLVPASCL